MKSLVALRVSKLLFALSRQRAFRALLAGVGAGVEHREALAGRRFATVVDAGANRGQFALIVRALFPKARIAAFEPLPGPAETFRTIFARDANAMLHPFALGAANGRREMHVAARDDSSSLLPIGGKQTAAFGTRETGRLEVETRRLDTVFMPTDIVAPALLKLDVQGYELEVLRGCGALLPLFDAIYAEVSYAELYEGQPLAPQVEEFLAGAGFRVGGEFNIARSPDGLPLQSDMLFLRSRGAP